MPRMLVVTAVAAERDAVLAGRTAAVGMVDGLEMHRTVTPAGLLDVVVAGVGPVAAAVATGCALRHGYDAVVSAGIGGGFGAAVPGTVTVADRIVHADLGAEDPIGFTSMADLGWGSVSFDADPRLSRLIVDRCSAMVGTILTVSTTTGSQQSADRLLATYPQAVAEAMEGVGVYAAASRAGVRFAEIRAISNRVGPRDVSAWQIPTALSALSAAFDRLLAATFPTGHGAFG